MPSALADVDLWRLWMYVRYRRPSLGDISLERDEKLRKVPKDDCEGLAKVQNQRGRLGSLLRSTLGFDSSSEQQGYCVEICRGRVAT